VVRRDCGCRRCVAVRTAHRCLPNDRRKETIMAWRRPSDELVDLFLGLVPDDPDAELRRMFGCPCLFLRGNMFAGIHQEDLMVRLSADDRAALLAVAGAHQFEPIPGRPMREYICVPQAMLAEQAALEEWVARALAYVHTLPPKVKKPRPPKQPAAPHR
jgi:TfoX/Sxy family transcriptional regulator of competence genes